MADYRDIVAAPGFRGAVISELLRVYREGDFPDPLRIGWIDPASDTPALVARACPAQGLRFRSWQQPCYRWFPAAGENLNKRFSRVRTHLNHLKKLGEVRFDIVNEPVQWEAFRDRFFEQHSLRQLQADRPVLFAAPQRRFYDRLFASPDVQTHVTALRADGELLAGHVGIVWRGSLMLGAPSIAIEHEQRSPALILISWIMQHAGELGLGGLDLTAGDTEFKRRLGNQRVDVTTIEVHSRPRVYYAHALRSRAIAVAKAAVARTSGESAWARRVKPAFDDLARRASAARETGLRAAVRDLAATATWASDREIGPDRLLELERDAAADLWQVNTNRVADLLLCDRPAGATARALRECARAYARHRAAGAALHTILSGTDLAGWCFSHPGAAAGYTRVTGLFILPDYRERGAAPALLVHAARAHGRHQAPRIPLAGR
jgi:hypothetical protein